MHAPRPEAQSGKFIPGVDCPVWRIPLSCGFNFPSILYKRDAPLFAEPNIIDSEPDQAERLRGILKERITEDGCPPEQFDRLEL
jgi:hypothetical protein